VRFLKANTVFNGTKNLPADAVLVIDNSNLFKEIVAESQVEKNNIEHFEGILTPGFVNAHCHLELSHLKEKIPQHTGLPGFAKHVIIQRSKFSKEEMTEHMHEADKAMWHNGIVAVGDISNGNDSFAVKTQSPIFYHTFIELIGLNPASQDLIFDKGLELLKTLGQNNLRGSLAPHAPYSTSAQLIKKIAEHNAHANLSLSIHNQESEEETKFFEGRPSGFDDLYKFLGLDLSWYTPPNVSSLQTYVNGLSENSPSILVHNTVTKKEDVLAANKKNSYWCFCPGANLYIENRLPDLDLFTTCADKICIGTDSLASNTQLHVLEEANILLKHSTAFSADTLLRALTSNAAAALGIANSFGNFIPGKNAGVNLVTIHQSQLRFIKKIL